ncbi:BTB and poz domain-containing protein-like protein, partial [Leptotrombidium deliense]
MTTIANSLQISFAANYSFEHLYCSEQLSDVYLEFGDPKEKIAAHRLLLSTNSDYFRHLFYGNKEQTVFLLNDTPNEEFKRLLKTFYTNSFDGKGLSVKQLVSCVQLASRFAMKNVESRLLLLLKRQIKSDNFLQFHFACNELKSTIDAFIEENMDTIIVNHSLIKSMPLEFLMKIIASRKISVDEIEVFYFCEQWLHEQNVICNRNIDPQTVMQHIQLELIDWKSLVNIVYPSKMFTEQSLIEALRKKTQ